MGEKGVKRKGTPNFENVRKVSKRERDIRKRKNKLPYERRILLHCLQVVNCKV